jgi:hypothetical protein
MQLAEIAFKSCLDSAVMNVTDCVVKGAGFESHLNPFGIEILKKSCIEPRLEQNF